MSTTRQAMLETPLVKMAGITKRFGGHIVLRDVSFTLRAGEVHLLAGENGAGKSTLIKILAGIHTDFDGQIRINGREVRPTSPLHANELGVAIIHQELSLVGAMSVADNIFLGRSKTNHGFVCDKAQRLEAAEWMRRFGLDIDVSQPVEQFPIATQQCIEIAKALSHEAQVIVMDEPTSALTQPETDRLFSLIEQLKEEGCGIVYITHKMEEVERIADRITVLRDGNYIGTSTAAELPPQRLIQWMVGKESNEQFSRHSSRRDNVRLELCDFSVYARGCLNAPSVQNASLAVRAGEIVGVGGLQGSGASDLFLGMFGAFGNQTSGRLLMDGREVKIASPRDAINSGIALLTNDRKQTGLVLTLSIIANIALASLRKLSVAGWCRPKAERRAASAMAEVLQLRSTDLEMPVSQLSGGNQQKVAIAKWLQTQPRLLLLDEPTRGIDIGAKHEIYGLIHRLAESGLAILLVTSEMPELLALSDRVVVLHRGRVMAELVRGEATPARVVAAAMGEPASRDQVVPWRCRA